MAMVARPVQSSLVSPVQSTLKVGRGRQTSSLLQCWRKLGAGGQFTMIFPNFPVCCATGQPFISPIVGPVWCSLVQHHGMRIASFALFRSRGCGCDEEKHQHQICRVLQEKFRRRSPLSNALEKGQGPWRTVMVAFFLPHLKPVRGALTADPASHWLKLASLAWQKKEKSANRRLAA